MSTSFCAPVAGSKRGCKNRRSGDRRNIQLTRNIDLHTVILKMSTAVLKFKTFQSTPKEFLMGLDTVRDSDVEISLEVVVKRTADSEYTNPATFPCGAE